MAAVDQTQQILFLERQRLQQVAGGMNHELQQLRAEGHRLTADVERKDEELRALNVLLAAAEKEVAALKKELAQVNGHDDAAEWIAPPPPVRLKRGRPPLVRQE